MTKPQKIMTVGAILVAVIIGIVYAAELRSVHPGSEPPPASLAALAQQKPAKPVPDVAFSDAGGNHIKLTSFKGRWVLLNLWATWCAPCVAELPALARLQAFAPGLKVLAVNTDRGGIDAAAFLKNHHVDLPVLRDSDTVMMKSFVVYGLPMTVLINPDGNVVARADGPAAWDDPEAVAYFKRIAGG
jgi:thiol-disulfide isomerase/thioredoxin